MAMTVALDLTRDPIRLLVTKPRNERVVTATVHVHGEPDVTTTGEFPVTVSESNVEWTLISDSADLVVFES